MPGITAVHSKIMRFIRRHAHAEAGRSQAAVVAGGHDDDEARQRQVVQRGVERRLRALRRPRGAGSQGPVRHGMLLGCVQRSDKDFNSIMASLTRMLPSWKWWAQAL